MKNTIVAYVFGVLSIMAALSPIAGAYIIGQASEPAVAIDTAPETDTLVALN